MLLRDRYRALRFIGCMDAPQRLQMRIVETLYAHRQPVHARLAIGRKTSRFHRAGIRLQRDLGVKGQRQQHAHVAQNLRRHSRRSTGWACRRRRTPYIPCVPRSAARPAPDRGSARRHIPVRATIPRSLMRIEIAIRAFAHAPRDVDIQRQRRQGLKIHGLRFDGDGMQEVCGHVVGLAVRTNTAILAVEPFCPAKPLAPCLCG